jgi:hypothetical protein
MLQIRTVQQCICGHLRGAFVAEASALPPTILFLGGLCCARVEALYAEASSPLPTIRISPVFNLGAEASTLEATR